MDDGVEEGLGGAQPGEAVEGAAAKEIDVAGSERGSAGEDGCVCRGRVCLRLWAHGEPREVTTGGESELAVNGGGWLVFCARRLMRYDHSRACVLCEGEDVLVGRGAAGD